MAFIREQERRVRHITTTCKSFTTNHQQANVGAAADAAPYQRPPTDLLTARDFIFDRYIFSHGPHDEDCFILW